MANIGKHGLLISPIEPRLQADGFIVPLFFLTRSLLHTCDPEPIAARPLVILFPKPGVLAMKDDESTALRWKLSCLWESIHWGQSLSEYVACGCNDVNDVEWKRWKSNQVHGAFDAVSAFQCLHSVASHSALLEVMARPSPTTQVKVLD